MYSDEDDKEGDYNNEEYDKEDYENENEGEDDGNAQLIVANIYKYKNDLPNLRKVYKLALGKLYVGCTVSAFSQKR
jgi:hypothetical protein